MIKCPVKLSDDDRWIALSLLAYIIKSDTQMMSLEIVYFKEEISKALEIDSSELEYFDEIMNREFDPTDFDKIGIPSDKIIAKHILKEAMHLSLVDGEYSSDEKAIIVRWAEKNELDSSFIENLVSYVRLVAQGDAVDDNVMQEAEKAAEILLNS